MTDESRYSALSASSILATLDRLEARVRERFPARGLAEVCGELGRIARRHVARLDGLARPHLGLRALVALVLAGGISAATFGIWQKFRLLSNDPSELFSFGGIEAIANIIILMGASVWFLLNLESRIKRSDALASLHELRSIAHVIDMHQLTKDPASILGAGPTASSPARDLSPGDLMRYLDYCTEMLSLTGKLAALCMQGLRDEIVIHAVNEIEALTTHLSGKIWQKIMIVRAEIDAVPLSAPSNLRSAP